MPKIGIMGGTFDPIHNGHTEMAKKAMERLKLSKVLFMTDGTPPHKEEITSAELRYQMVKLAIKTNRNFEASDYELKKQGYSYTAQTLEFLKKENPQNDYYFIMGADSLNYMDKWYKPEVIFSLAKIVVFSRSDFDCRKKTDMLIAKFGGQVIILNDDIPDISSTMIRKYADMGQDISGFVNEDVEKIIWTKRLYRGKFSDLRVKVMNSLEEKRFAHTLGVCAAAVKMAGVYKENPEKAYVAALLHDCAKNIPEDEMYELCEEKNVELDEYEKRMPALVHAKLGAQIAKEKYGVFDEDIINAVRWHTLGRKEMSRLEKIIFVADMVEENRKFPGVDRLRAKMYDNLEHMVYLCYEATVKFNEEKGGKIHPDAYSAMEYFKNNS